MKTAGEKFAEVQALLGKLEDMKKRPFRYALTDLNDWMNTDLDKVSNLLDEIEYDVKDYVLTRYSKPDMYSQLELVHESTLIHRLEVAHAR